MSGTAHTRRKSFVWESTKSSNGYGKVLESLASVTKQFQTLQSYCTPEVSPNVSRSSEICHGGYEVSKAETFHQEATFQLPMSEKSSPVPSGRGISMTLPLFYGENSMEFVSWLFGVECFFKEGCFSDESKFVLALTCFRSHALELYQDLKHVRKRRGKREIRSWHKLKVCLKNEYLSEIVMSNLLFDMRTLKQGDLSVIDYIHEFEELSFICDVHEKQEDTNIRFFGGLQPEIGLMFELNLDWSFEELCKKALEVEACLKDGCVPLDVPDLFEEDICPVELSKSTTCHEVIDSSGFGFVDVSCSEMYIAPATLSMEGLQECRHICYHEEELEMSCENGQLLEDSSCVQDSENGLLGTEILAEQSDFLEDSKRCTMPHLFRSNATLLMLQHLKSNKKHEPSCTLHVLALCSVQQTYSTHVFDPGGERTSLRPIQASNEEPHPTSAHLLPLCCKSVPRDCIVFLFFEVAAKRKFLILIFDPGDSRACESTRINTLMLVFAPSALFTSLAVQVHMVLKWRRSGVPMPFDDLGLWITKFEDKFFSNKGSMQQEQGVGGSHFL